MQPSNRTIAGIAMVLFGTVLLGVGIHHVVSTGTCSSTGYSSNYGPVPYCPKGTGWWIMFVVVGILLSVFGGLISGGPSALLITPAVFAGIGIGSLTILLDAHVKSSTKTFAGIFGGAFALFGVVPLLIGAVGGLRSLGSSPRGRRSAAFGSSTTEPDAIMGAYTATPTPAVPATPAPRPPSTPLLAPRPQTSGDALDKLTKLAKLREDGALTEDEFNRQKAKLLAEM